MSLTGRKDIATFRCWFSSGLQVTGTLFHFWRAFHSRIEFDNPSRLGYSQVAASLRFGNVLFIAYPQDHETRHVHGFWGETEVIVDIGIDGSVALADRADCIRPGNAKRSEVRMILRSAAEHFEKLVSLWERMHA